MGVPVLEAVRSFSSLGTCQVTCLVTLHVWCSPKPLTTKVPLATDTSCRTGSSSGSGTAHGGSLLSNGAVDQGQVTPRAPTTFPPGKDAPSASDLAAMLCVRETSVRLQYEPLSEAQIAAARQVAQLYVQGRDGCAISVDEPTILNDTRIANKHSK